MRRSYPSRRRSVLRDLFIVLGGGVFAGLAVAVSLPRGLPDAVASVEPAAVERPRIERGGSTVAAGERVSFGFCHAGGGTNCVVDGDTFWMHGEKVRVADIDAPETHPSRCPSEAKLGKAATQRLQALLNAGPIELAQADRDTDRYGRKLRIVARGGESLGDQLVREGLARPWTGRRQPWC